ncbi:hypothetical protein [Thalassospira profundimaris]|uniref:hypothetical protein n=1 Tax=Thalassospira profundimaris TaxID=502049 RepID=UPI0011BD5C71|nr:hypothetical protein [Thalassospira profundimaris]
MTFLVTKSGNSRLSRNWAVFHVAARMVWLVVYKIPQRRSHIVMNDYAVPPVCAQSRYQGFLFSDIETLQQRGHIKRQGCFAGLQGKNQGRAAIFAENILCFVKPGTRLENGLGRGFRHHYDPLLNAR